MIEFLRLNPGPPIYDTGKAHNHGHARKVDRDLHPSGDIGNEGLQGVG